MTAGANERDEAIPFWERAEVVAKFASRDPDLRLRALLDDEAEPARLRALDLGCAGGRNAELLARRGVDLTAVDRSRAMVARTRRRLTPILGAAEAARRVRRGAMDELGWLDDGSIDLIVALGVYHSAASFAEWRRAVAESRRVLAAGGRLLVAHFTPRTDLDGEGMRPVAGERHVFEGFAAGRGVLLDAATLDREMARLGLRPLVPTAVVEVATERGRRVTANALYGLSA